jgi:hypothetical protein
MIMGRDTGITKMAVMVAVCISALFLTSHHAGAHCDTMAGPVIQDARKALNARDVTPVLKWVREKDEKAVKIAFDRAVAARGGRITGKARKEGFSKRW